MASTSSSVASSESGAAITNTSRTTLTDTSMVGDDKTKITGDTDQTLIGDAGSASFSDTTGFRSEGKVEERIFDPSREDASLLGTLRPSQEDHHFIETILARPTRIDNIVFSAKTTPGTIISSYDILSLLRTDTCFQIAREKLSGFYGFHATAHLKIVFNAQPFEQGIFHIWFQPMLRNMNINAFNYDEGPIWINSELSLPYATSCPNVFCNVATQSEAVLSIPYTGPNVFINLTNPDLDWGVFYVQSIVALDDSTNNASCDMTVFMYFTDVRLFGATPNSWATPNSSTYHFQGFGDEATRKTQGQRNDDPISGILGNLLGDSGSAIASTLMDTIGLSKPVTNLNPSRMALEPFGAIGNFDTTSTAFKMSMNEHQTVQINQLGIDNKDEMDISYFLSKPTYLRTFVWTTDDKVGTDISAFEVEPTCNLSSTAADRTVVFPTRLRYMANLFMYWRGTVRFTFHVAATKFHSGRIRFVYSLGGAMPSLPDKQCILYPYTYSQIFDVRDAKVFTVDVPYFSSTPWKLVPQKWDDANNKYVSHYEGIYDDATAYLQIFVENTLRASESVSKSIRMAVFVSAGPDFEFNSLIAPLSLPYVRSKPGKSASESELASVEHADYQYQGPGDEDVQAFTMVSIGPGTETMKASASKVTIGEGVKNMRAMLKRYQIMGTQHVEPDDLTYQNFCLYPFSIIERRLAAEGDYVGPNLTYELLSYIQPLFRFWRGGMRYLVQTIGANDTHWTIRFDAHSTAELLQIPVTNIFTTNRLAMYRLQDDDTTDPFRDQNIVSSPMALTQPFVTKLQGGFEIEVPFYSRSHKLLTYCVSSGWKDNTNYDAITKNYLPNAFIVGQLENPAKQPFRVNVYRAVADDFNFGYLLGPPPTVVNVTLLPKI